MKLTKRALALALALILALALALPAMAEEPDDPNVPILTWVQSNPTDFDNRIAVGETLVLEVAATLPEGVDGELSIEWFVNDALAATGPTLELEIEFITYHVQVVVTNTYIDEDGEEQTATKTLSTEVFVFRPYTPVPLTFWGRIWSIAKWPVAGLYAIFAIPLGAILFIPLLLIEVVLVEWLNLYTTPVPLAIALLIILQMPFGFILG